jgi:hypothetical protein
MRMPSKRPDTTTAIADPRRAGGARSATSGMRIWGATDVNPTRKEMISNTKRLFVIASPTVKVVDSPIKSNINWRRRSMSPSGVINRRPIPYLEPCSIIATLYGF